MTKEALLTAVKQLPDEEVNLDNFMENLRFIKEAEEGFKDFDDGNTVTLEEAKKLFNI